MRGEWEREGAAVAGEEAEAGPGRLAYYAGKLGFIWKIFKLRNERCDLGFRELILTAL